MFRSLMSLLGLMLSAAVGLCLLLIFLAAPQAWPVWGQVIAPVSLAPLNAPVNAPANAAAEAAIQFTVTVGLIPEECASATVVTATAGTEVTYCFTVANTGDVTFTDHTVQENGSEVSQSFTEQVLGPDSVFILNAVGPVEESTVNTFTWTSTNTAGAYAVAQASVRMVVPAIAVTHTVGVDPHSCALSNTVTVPSGALVTHCYQVTNRDVLTFYTHAWVDTHIGVQHPDLPYTLSPDATLIVTASEVATVSGPSVVTWTATVSEGLYAVDGAAASILVPAIEATSTLGTNLTECATTSEITVTVGEVVLFCLVATNRSGVAFNPVFVSDTLSGPEPRLVTDTLADNGVATGTITAPITASAVYTAVWLGYTEGGITATTSTSVTVNTLARIDAVAYYDVDQDGEYDPLESGVIDATMVLEAQDGVSDTLQTDETGVATFDALANGHYTVTVSTNDLALNYSVNTAANIPPILIDVGKVYTTAIPLILLDGTDSDDDSIPDHIEGSDDFDGDGIPDYLDPDNYFFAPMTRQR